jgi:hypothetical protein
MTLELEAFPAEARKRQIELGRGFSSELTLNQANQTLAAYARYRDDVSGHGFTEGDAGRLEDARDLLIAAGVGRDFAREEKQVASRGVDEALSRGQGLRLRARSILEGIEEDVEESGLEGGITGAAETRRRIAAVLERTSLAADTRERLAAQLDRLAQVLGDEVVAQFAAARSGIEVIEPLVVAATELREAEKQRAGMRGTPDETQRLDQIDGIIIRLVRRARKASLSAARAAGNPALSNAFKLTQLYRSRGNTAFDEDIDEGAGDLPPQDRAAASETALQA